MALKVQPFKFEPFSQKQLQVLTWWLPNSPVRDKDMIIADGSVRSGKTVSMSLSYVQWAMDTFDGENLGMAGKTIGSFRRNVLAPLKRMLKALNYRVKDHRADNMVEISRNGKTNFFYIFGGKDERSQDLIQGITLAGMLFDEVALMPQSFVNQATARCSVAGSKFWFNCNPEGPYHWFNQEYIIKAEEKNAVYLHFTMDDNLSLTEEIKARYRRDFTGLFFKRYILGLWVMAAGAIYDMFDAKKHVIDCSEMEFDEYYTAGDYGASNPTTFGLFGVSGDKAYLIKQYWYDARAKQKQKTNTDYADDYEKFIDGYKVKACYIDPNATAFITELRNRGHKVIKANNDVFPGIMKVGNMLGLMRLFIDKTCKMALQEFESYIWDVKAQEKNGEDKPLKQHDHAMDMIRYFIYSYFRKGKLFSMQV